MFFSLQYSPDARLQVIHNLDLMEIVFNAFQPQVFPEDKKHLLSAALSSKCLFDPAMDVLWRSIDSLIPVNHCVPSNYPHKERS